MPGFASFTKWYDKSVDTGAILPQNKATSILGYLATGLYDSIGTPVNATIDFLGNLFNKNDVKKVNSN